MSSAVHDLSGAYALDALDDLERARFDAHSVKCSTCQRDVAEFRAAAAHLGRRVAEPPPPALRARVLEAITEVRQDRAGSPRPAPSHTSRWLTAAAGVAAALVIGLLTTQLISVRQDRDRREHLTEVLSAPDAVVMALEGDTGHGRMVWSPALGRSVIVLDDLPEVAADRGYQLWFVIDGAVIPADVYRPDGHRLVVEAGDLPEGLDALGFTEEPIEGSPQPHGPMLINATA